MTGNKNCAPQAQTGGLYFINKGLRAGIQNALRGQNGRKGAAVISSMRG